MPFTTLAFAGFFAALLLAYYTIPRRFQWWLLLAGSMAFYGYASLSYLLLLWAIILVTYLGTIAIGREYARRDAYLRLHKQELSRESRKTYKDNVAKAAKAWLIITLIVLVATLGVFKYAQFALDNFFRILGLLGIESSPDFALRILLPVGLSFYVFQVMGYCIDVFREEVLPERNLFKYALFVSFFPQLMQGPIGNYGRLAPQLTAQHDCEYEEVVLGLQRVAWGVFKKFMIANVIAHRTSAYWTAIGDYRGLLCWWLVLMFYAIQLYADFSGYMDIACGCAQTLGIRLEENFNLPYLSKSVPEFWRRWHMTLSDWFKNYLFYPLLRAEWCARLRKSFSASKYLASVIPTSLALAIVWTVTGLWHGASWGYVAWGCYYGVFMIANIVMQPIYDKINLRCPAVASSYVMFGWRVMRTFAIVVFGYSIFKPADMSVTLSIWEQMCSSVGVDAGREVLKLFGKMFYMSVAVLILVDVWHYWHGGDTIRRRLRKWPAVYRWSGYIVFTWLVLFYGRYGAGFDYFEYFKF